METNAARMCALLVGLPDISVVGVEDQTDEPPRVVVETIVEIEGCSGCGRRAWVKDRTGRRSSWWICAFTVLRRAAATSSDVRSALTGVGEPGLELDSFRRCEVA